MSTDAFAACREVRVLIAPKLPHVCISPLAFTSSVLESRFLDFQYKQFVSTAKLYNVYRACVVLILTVRFWTTGLV
jgi:hypothetical protein